MKRALCLTLVLLALAHNALAELRFRNFDDPDAPQWKESDIALPAYPQEANLREFYVSETTANRFYIDGSTLSVSNDGVVRFVLVVRTSGGATNITYEGIRCESREFRLYASGRQDGTWANARKSEWKAIENKPINRHHAALSRDLFCPSGSPISSAEDGRNALKLGKHPNAI